MNSIRNLGPHHWKVFRLLQCVLNPQTLGAFWGGWWDPQALQIQDIFQPLLADSGRLRPRYDCSKTGAITISWAQGACNWGCASADLSVGYDNPELPSTVGPDLPRIHDTPRSTCRLRSRNTTQGDMRKGTSSLLLMFLFGSVYIPLK